MSRRSALPLFPDGLSDESAAVLSEFLNQLAVACESRYFVQLRRYHQRQMNLYDPEAPLADPAAAASVAPSSHAAAGIDVPVAAWDSASVSTAKSLGRGL
jgi:hypothetical protein